MRGLLIILSKVLVGILHLSLRNNMFGELLMDGEARLESGVREVKLMSLVVGGLMRRRISRIALRHCMQCHYIARYSLRTLCLQMIGNIA